MTPAEPARAPATASHGELLSPGVAAALFREAGIAIEDARPEYLRTKSDGVIVAYRLTGTSGGSSISLPGYLRSVTGPGRAALTARWAGLRATGTPFGPGAAVLPDRGVGLFVFPNDAGLRKLRLAADPRRLKRALAELPAFGGAGFRVRGRHSDVTAVRYKPERRFVARATVGLIRDDTGERIRRDVFIRLFRDARGTWIARISRALREGAGPALFPEPLGTAWSGRLYVEAAVEGECLVPAILASRIGAEEVGEALARLHRSNRDLGREIRTADLLVRLRAGLALLGDVEPPLAQVINRVLRRLERTDLAGPRVPLHGDLHLHQFVVSDRGLVMVDLERAGIGDPLVDVGEVGAHLSELALERPADAVRLEAFREGVVEEHARRVGTRTARDVAGATAAALANRALLRYRSMSPDWRDRSRELLASALGLIEAEGPRTASPKPAGLDGMRGLPPAARWEVLYPRRESPWPAVAARTGDGRGTDRHDGPAGNLTYGLYHPDEDRFQAVDPGDDPVLRHLGPWARRGSLVAYRVGRRATVRVEDPRADGGAAATAYAKVLPPRKAHRVGERWRLVAEATARSEDPDLPRLPALIDARTEGVLLLKPVPGPSLHDVLMGRSRDVSPALDRTARALAALHRLDAARTGLRPARPGMALIDYSRLVAAADPALAAPYEQARLVVESAGGTDLQGDRLIHGDLHDKNVMLGAETALLDLDLVRPGDPAEDVGNLAAHLVLRALQRGDDVEVGRALASRFLEAYGRTGGEVDAPAVRRVIARTLFRLACLYRFRRRWRGLTLALLEEARRMAEAAFRLVGGAGFEPA